MAKGSVEWDVGLKTEVKCPGLQDPFVVMVEGAPWRHKMSDLNNFPGTLPVRAGPEDEGPSPDQAGTCLPIGRPIYRSLVQEGTNWPKQGRQEESWRLGIRDGVGRKEHLGQDEIIRNSEGN